MAPEREVSLEEKVHLLLEFSREVSSTLDLQEVLDQSLVVLRRLISFDGGSIQLVFDGALQLVATDPPAPPEAYEARLPLGQGLGGRIAVTCEPIYSPDALADPRADLEGLAKAASVGIRSYFGVPLIEHGGAIGVVQLDSETVDAFPARTRELVLAFTPSIAAAVQNARMFQNEVQTLDRLREAEQLKHDFVAVVSHELRTPLTSIIGISETLAMHGGDFDEETVRDLAERISRNGGTLKRLIEDLLDVSTIERGVLSVESVPVDVGRLITEVVTAVYAPGHPIEVKADAGLPLVAGDADRLAQVLRNLVDNAQKFSAPGAPIEIRVERERDRVAIRVTDHGFGIPSALHERIFERFYQCEEATTRSAKGLGVGLYLVRHLCELMGATVRVISEPGRGSTFSISLATTRRNASFGAPDGAPAYRSEIRL